jgi:hypothetical protein
VDLILETIVAMALVTDGRPLEILQPFRIAAGDPC